MFVGLSDLDKMDLIDRTQLMVYIRSKKINIGKLAHDIIMEQPSIQVQESKTGHWLIVEDLTNRYDTAYKCSCCGREIITPYEFKNDLYIDYPYCHCGCRMVESQESEE